MLGAVTVALRTPDKGIAQRDLKRMIDVAERERRVVRSLDELPGAGRESIEASLQRFQQDLRAKRPSEKYVADVGRRVRIVLALTGWNSLQQVSAAGFQAWRGSQVRKAAKTLNEYQNAWNAFLNWAVKLRIIPDNPLSVVGKVLVRGNEVRARLAEMVKLKSTEEFKELFGIRYRWWLQEVVASVNVLDRCPEGMWDHRPDQVREMLTKCGETGDLECKRLLLWPPRANKNAVRWPDANRTREGWNFRVLVKALEGVWSDPGPFSVPERYGLSALPFRYERTEFQGEPTSEQLAEIERTWAGLERIERGPLRQPELP